MASSVEDRESESSQIGLWVGESFAEGPRREAVTERIEPEVVAWSPSDAVAGVVAFLNDPDRLERIPGDTPAVVATTEPDVAATAADRSVRVVRWDPEAPPWSFLRSTLATTVDAVEPPAEPGGDDTTRNRLDGSPEELRLARDIAAVEDGPAPTIATYDQLMETVGDAVYALDTEGHFTYVNEAMSALTGYEEEEIIGAPPGIIKDEQAVHEAERALAGMLSSDGPDDASVELDVVKKDGERVPCEDHMTLLTEDGQFRGTVGTLRDLTTQKRREEMFAGLLDATQEMMTAEDPRAIAGIAARTVEETLDRELVTVRLRDGDELEPIAASRVAREVLPPRPTYGVDEGPVGEAYQQETVIERAASEIDDDRDRGEATAALYLPLGDYGVMIVGTRDDEFGEQDRYFAELLAATTERALSRAEREQSLRRYEKLVETVDEMAFAADEDGRFTLVTPQFAAATGRDREALIGEPVETVGDGVFESLVEELAAGGSSVVREGAICGDGDHVPIRARGSAVSADELDGFVVAATDISDLVSARREVSRSRERFGGLFEALADPVAELRVRGETAELLRTNEAFEDAATGGDASETFDGRELPAAVAEELTAAAGRARSGAQGTRSELTVTRAGRTRHFVARDVPVRVDDEARSFVVFTDVTDLVRRERHTTVLTRILRHNLRNELTVLRGYAGEVRRRADDSELESAAERIEQAGGRLTSLSETAGVIQRILRDGNRTLVDHDVAALFREVVAETEDRHPQATVEVSGDVDGTITGTQQLGHALIELVDNGIEHHSDPDAEVRVTAERTDEHVTVVVADDGPPIPTDEWAVVTDRQEITQLQHGSGLGLWLVRWVIEDHGGELTLRENGPEGTEIAVRLPVDPPEFA